MIREVGEGISRSVRWWLEIKYRFDSLESKVSRDIQVKDAIIQKQADVIIALQTERVRLKSEIRRLEQKMDLNIQNVAVETKSAAASAAGVAASAMILEFASKLAQLESMIARLSERPVLDRLPKSTEEFPRADGAGVSGA